MSNATNLTESMGKLKRMAEIANRMDEINAGIVEYAKQVSEGNELPADYLHTYHVEMLTLISEQERLQGLEEPSESMKSAMALSKPGESRH